MILPREIEIELDELAEPAMEEACRVAVKLIKEKWPAFWQSHIRHLALHLSDPDSDLAKYKHSTSVKVEIRSTAKGVTVQPSMSFGLRESYQGDIIPIEREEQTDFLSDEPGPVALVPPEKKKKRGKDQ